MSRTDTGRQQRPRFRIASRGKNQSLGRLTQRRPMAYFQGWAQGSFVEAEAEKSKQIGRGRGEARQQCRYNWAFTRSDRLTDRSVRLVCPTGRSDDRIV